MEIQIHQKAYKVWHEGMLNENPHEGYTIEELPVTYADTPSEAKRKADLLSDYEIDGEEHKFTDIRVKRAKNADWIFDSDGKKIRRWELVEREKNKKRIEEETEKLNKFPDGTYFYVQSGYVGNCVMWWAKGNRGYQVDIEKAEMYTKDEILNDFIKAGRKDETIWECSHVDANIQKYVDAQYLEAKFKI